MTVLSHLEWRQSHGHSVTLTHIRFARWRFAVTSVEELQVMGRKRLTGKLVFVLACSRLSISGKGSKNRVDDKQNQRRAGSIWTHQHAFSIVPSDWEPGIGYFLLLFCFVLQKAENEQANKSCVVVRISLGVYWLTANLVDRLPLLGLPCRQASQQNASKCLPTHGVPMNVIQRILTQ